MIGATMDGEHIFYAWTKRGLHILISLNESCIDIEANDKESYKVWLVVCKDIDKGEYMSFEDLQKTHPRLSLS